MRKKNVKRMFGYSMMMGGSALLAGKLPAPANTPMQIVATRGSKFVAPIAAVTGAAEAINQLEKIKKLKRRYR